MIRFFIVRKPGPTDLTWDDINSSNYLYRQADLSALKDFSTGRSVSKDKRTRRKRKEN